MHSETGSEAGRDGEHRIMFPERLQLHAKRFGVPEGRGDQRQPFVSPSVSVG